MNFEQLKVRVERSERLVEGRLEQTRAHATALKTTWRDSWTPSRIVIAGLVSGFLVGRSRPTRALRRIGKLGGPHWIQLIGTLSGLFASLQSTFAAATAQDAAETAGDTAVRVDAAVSDPGTGLPADAAAPPAATAVTAEPEAVPPADRRRRPDPVWDAPPRPAEAATELSER